MQQNAYYKVAVTDGTIIDSEGRYLRDAIAYDCGHNHRTEAAAKSCHKKLTAWSKAGRECSARWYNSKVLRVDADGRHFPPTSTELATDFPGYCVDCGESVPEAVAGVLCSKCETKWAAK